ncbi:hypothetical protein [Streptomyces sp. NPDC017940]|uniref:phosphorylase family protein n=1 Tax=Streptomyces sp. NPDC017940 TaxID=3365017 RepID=UPI00378C927C
MVVLTALQVEYEAMLHHLRGVQEVETPQGTLLDVGRVPGLAWQVALAETGPTNTRAALVAESAIEHFDAEAVFFVGVAGALKDHVRLGDVVVASKIYGYHGGRESQDGFNARPSLADASHRVDQLVRSARRNAPWAYLTPPPDPSAQPDVHFEPIAAGDVLIGSRDSETARRIRRHYNDAVAVDMESHGVAQAARMHAGIEMLAVRGISDLAGPEKAAADARGSQRTASRHAAAFALRILRDLRPAGRAPRVRPERPTAFLVSGPRRDTGTAGWESRPVVRAGDQEYLLYEGPDDLLQESREGDVVRRQAVARVTSASDRNSRGSYVWLRQVQRRGPLPGAACDPLTMLEREAKLSLRHRGPGVVQVDRRGDTATLALVWPADRRLGRPYGTLYDLLPAAPRGADPLRLLTIVKGLAAVAQFLAGLHAGELSHRALRPTAIVMNQQRAFLRDFGLAAVPPRPGEHVGPYQAPEQRHGSAARPGPAADVYQLGALLHHALTGRPPVPGLPPSRPPGAVPDRLVRAATNALRQDPAARPGVRVLHRELLAGTRDLLAAPPHP